MAMQRLWLKLTLAFLVTALIAVGLVAALALRSTGAQFRRYVVHASMAGQGGLTQRLADYHAATGGWAGVATVLAEPGSGGGRGWGRTRLLLADAAGQVVYSASGELLDQRLSATALAQGLPITAADGAAIGTLLSLEPASASLDAQGQAFLDRVRDSLLWAGVGAVGLAVLLGVWFSRQLTAPLRQLEGAAARVAAGDLATRVAASGRDEVGDLGRAFNTMAAALQAGETLRRNLMADVAHELRTPLTVIQGNLQAMLDGVYPLDGAQVAGVYDETRLLTRLVEDLRELALAEAGQLTLQFRPVDCLAVAQTASANFSPAAEAAGVALALDAAADLPILRGDGDRLSQVLRNLLSNALRYTPAGGRVTVCLSHDQATGGVLCRVSDTGSGIPPDELPHVFDRFYRGAQRGGGSGSGLGLAIARQIVLAHGGHIAVESTVGAGTQFSVWLPQKWDADSMPRSFGHGAE